MASEHTCARYDCRRPFKDHADRDLACPEFVETLVGHGCDSGHFDRSVCPEPCGAMHSFCTLCGARVDPCPHQGSAPTDRIPTREEADLARRALAGFGDLRGPLAEHGPATVVEAFAFLEQTVRTAEHIAATQPSALAGFRADLVATVAAALREHPDTDPAEAAVDALLESVTLARMLAGEPPAAVRTPDRA